MQEKNDTERVYTLHTAPVELEAIDEVSDHKRTEVEEPTAYALPYPPSAGPVELEATPRAFAELWGSDVNPLPPLPQIKLSSQEPVQRTKTSPSWGEEEGKGERLQADAWLSSNRTRNTKKPEDSNYF